PWAAGSGASSATACPRPRSAAACSSASAPCSRACPGVRARSAWSPGSSARRCSWPCSRGRGGRSRMADAGLRVRALEVSLSGRAVVCGVDLDAAPGAMTAVLGPNGAGKTTLVRAVVGLVPCAGTIHVDGAELGALAPRQRARLVAYVPQRSALDVALRVDAVVGQGRYA